MMKDEGGRGASARTSGRRGMARSRSCENVHARPRFVECGMVEPDLSLI